MRPCSGPGSWVPNVRYIKLAPRAEDGEAATEASQTQLASMATFAKEALLVRLLEQMLGPYVADLSRDKLHGVGVWSGNVVLTDLALREDALDGCARSAASTRARHPC